MKLIVVSVYDRASEVFGRPASNPYFIIFSFSLLFDVIFSSA